MFKVDALLNTKIKEYKDESFIQIKVLPLFMTKIVLIVMIFLKNLTAKVQQTFKTHELEVLEEEEQTEVRDMTDKVLNSPEIKELTA